ncbi:MAG TPA: LLM class F420-dependent oxidoreductase [Steroidobacteraceae bacterium]|nr:LLM class F420-dependent oxidoreductase [Steroidobacteraceae bacterium]
MAEYGVHLPQILEHANREGLLQFARLAEENGYDSVWTSDHIVVPRQIASRYPYRSGGDFPAGAETPWLDPIATLTFAAAVTARVRLGTSVLIVPYRNPVVTAKLLATLDVLSAGRLILGVGVGWMEEEFSALGIPFAGRGPRTNEYLELMQRLWTEERPLFEGRFYHLEDVGFCPKPLQSHLPIWVGGDTEAAFRRAGELADGYHAFQYPPDRLRLAWEKVRRYAEEAGRDPDRLTLSVRLPLRRGNPATLAAELGAYAETGVRHFVFDVGLRTLESAAETLHWFASEVRPRVAPSE